MTQYESVKGLIVSNGPRVSGNLKRLVSIFTRDSKTHDYTIFNDFGKGRSFSPLLLLFFREDGTLAPLEYLGFVRFGLLSPRTEFRTVAVTLHNHTYHRP